MNIDNALKTDSKPEQKKNKRFITYLKLNWQLYILLLVPLGFAFVFKYAPLSGLVLAFKDYKLARGIWGSEWVGFQIFQEIFAHREFLQALRNTLLLNFLDLILGFIVPIFLALLLNEIKNMSFKRFNQSLLYLPHFISWPIIGAIAYTLLGLGSGLINNLIEAMGGDRIPFLQEDIHWLFSYLGINVWAGMGWGTIIYLAAMSGVNPELYEASTVDGAGRWRKMWNVTLPGIRSTIVVLLIMNLGRIMGGGFENIFALQNKATDEFTTTLTVLVFRWGIERGGFSTATAAGLFQSVIGLILILIADRVAKKLGEDGLL